MWIQLLAIAMECNQEGKLIIGESTGMDIKDFSKITGKSSKTLQRIIRKFLEMDMLIEKNGILKIKNWMQYQSVDKTTKKQKKSNHENVNLEQIDKQEENREEIELRKEENIRKEKRNGFKLYEDI